MRICVAIPVPIAGGFDYRWPGPGRAPAPGTRVRVPFGSGERIGIVIAGGSPAAIDAADLKTVTAVLDPEPLIDPELLATLEWAAGYYHHPIGEVLQTALPGQLRKGRAAQPAPELVYRLTSAGLALEPGAIGRRAPRQAEALARLAEAGPLSAQSLVAAGISRATLRRLAEQGWIRAAEESPVELPRDPAATGESDPTILTETPPALTEDQHAAVEAARADQGFAVSLLFGVTGSGKTEVFLRLIGDALTQGRQCLLLVPEIGLTPQLVRRLRARFGPSLAVFHSGLTAGERLQAWRAARSGEARLVVGTRSAAFAPLRDAGLIVVDEEHDPSFKQQSGFRYSGRDLAIMRAKNLGIPVLLASATPSIESYHNAIEGRYRMIRLPRRIGAGGTPTLRIIDLNKHVARQGISTPLLTAMERHLADGNQVMLFINRRGFAPALFCPNCELVADCGRCDARLTVHAAAAQLKCHHCGHTESLRWSCPGCGSERIAVGAGTQRVTNEIESLFPDFPVARLDRDAIGGREALGDVLQSIEAGHARIIVGTQLLTKGHDFPTVTLVGILNADQGLFGADFRSEERLAQTIVQVSGRAGRREATGEVLIQTHYPGHPLLQRLLDGDYGDFADHVLAERQATQWPPFTHLAMFRAEAVARDRVFALLRRLRQTLEPDHAKVQILGPTPDWMERREGRYRAQLLLQASSRAALHAATRSGLQALGGWRESRRVRWSVDVDPIEL